MPTKRLNSKHIHAHMKSAFNYADCSTAEKLKVGCVLVKDDRIISIGYNGMPPDGLIHVKRFHSLTNSASNSPLKFW